MTSTVSSSTGKDARITITGISTDVDTLYVSNVQGEFGSSGTGKAFTVGAGISYFANDGTLTSIGTNDILTATGTGGVYSGNYMRVNHFNHGMYSNTNKVILSDVQSNIEPTTLSATLSVSDITSVSVANTSNFTTFEGVDVSASNPGYIKINATDTLDFRPRVSVFDPTTATISPFDFSSRSFDSVPKLLMAPGEGSIVGYEYYLPRIDKLYIDKYGTFIVEKGISSKYPKAPTKNDALLEIASINLPPYLYVPQNASISLIDNRRFTMRGVNSKSLSESRYFT